MSTRLVLAATVALAAGCSAPRPPVPLDLRAATGQADVRASGVAVDPSGTRYVLDERRGLYRIGADGFELVLARAAMPIPGVPTEAPLTDLVAIGPGRFVITALGEGFLLDLELGTVRPYFGAQPAGLPAGQSQRTDAVAYDPVADVVYAQQRTFDAGGNPLASQVASYALATGADLQRLTVTGEVAARGMAMVPGANGLVLGVTTGLCSLVRDDVQEVIDLAAIGILRIDGLAVDRVAHTLLVVDGAGAQLLELDLADVFP